MNNHINAVITGTGSHAPSEVLTNRDLEKMVDTSAASVPIALDEANRKGLLKKGDYIVMVAFGGGLTRGASLVQW